MPPRPLPPPIITLFTHPSCSLCRNAKDTLSRVWNKRPFTYEENNVQDPSAKEKGWDLYSLDVPVVTVQWDKNSEKRTVMHKIEESEILRLIKEVEAEKKKTEDQKGDVGPTR